MGSRAVDGKATGGDGLSRRRKVEEDGKVS
jgi:hypothetical protein